MSGITPLIDTLLHQVLGKRVDTPPARDLNQPVKPTSPADAPRALHSDSRLDARTNPAKLPELGRASREHSNATPRLIQPQGQPPASAQTHFSNSARTISDLLVRFPAPPSIMTTTTPLMAPGQAANPSMLAPRLEDSIRYSGLFYESHLARWYKGELPRHQLDREPQMWRTLNFLPAGTSQGATPSGSLALARHILFQPTPPFTQGHRDAALPHMANGKTTASTPMTANTAPNSAAASAQAASPAIPQAASGQDNSNTANIREALHESTLRAHTNQPVHESLQGIVRHQLEMLVTPALRWEGDVWSGLFMALLIQPPPGHQERPGKEDSDQQQDSSEGESWRSELDLDIAGIGRLKASLWMNTNSVEIDLVVAQDQSRQRLESGLDTLRARIAGHGFEDIKIALDQFEKRQMP